MSDTQTETPSHEQTAGEGTRRGKHRGEAAVPEEQPNLSAQGRHRRPAQSGDPSAPSTKTGPPDPAGQTSPSDQTDRSDRTGQSRSSAA